MSNSSPDFELLRYADGQLAYYMEHRNIVEEKVTVALHWLADGLRAQGWDVKDPDSLVQLVMDEFYLMTVDDTLVAFSLAELWFMQGQIIDEEFIAPVGESPAPIKLVVEALSAAGAAAGCVMLSLGTRANPRQESLARLFERAGCKRATTGFVKEIPNG